MKIAIMQPYFFPYIGYFQLINAVDKFIFYDDVNFINKGWINRNKILLNGKDHFFTLPLKSASQNKLINQIEICENNNKIIKTIKHAYSKAIYFEDVLPLIRQVIDKIDEMKSISKIAEISVKLVTEYLNINRIFYTSSEDFKFSQDLHGEKRIIAICKKIGADTYINPSGIKGFYNHENFKENGIRLFYIENNIKPYRQFNNDFISHLSIIDVLMFNSIEDVNILLDDYKLI